ncbi:T9SS type A sorting domain-containing protein [Hymenobacter sp. BT18]|uniref:T9SS type A sorting domain-containing protein n=1 Tax=Hymenobacter sp. BT18 TaxID=2835648 RepID=UPI00143E99E4|nr:T9SS type A sorting domain-containing protein [Hymenobacter sp. BT18]QIX60110.1 T9SS type A sorting domain-containing protein [Hymenobacter sp. BT18]
MNPLLAAYRCTLVVLALLLGGSVQAQRFWLTTRDFPLGPKTGLIATNDSTLFTAVAAGVLRTTNQGRSWALALRTARPVYCLHTTRAGVVLAGGLGKVYRSFDAGTSWDSVALATPYPISTLLEPAPGELLAGTGMLDFDQGYLGSGVFHSTNNGQTWEARNVGLGTGRYVNRLAADGADRWYLSITDETSARQPGLYVSTSHGQQWQFVPLRVKGFEGTLTPYQITALAVSPQDSLLVSFEGSGGNFAVSLNLSKRLSDLTDATVSWTVHRAIGSSHWWESALLTNMHFARNGDWYSSCKGSLNTGATLVSKDRGQTWTKVAAGLGLTQYNNRLPQSFVEASDGKILMVQDMDERVYWTDASVVTATARPQRGQLSFYPNPATSVIRLDNRTGQSVQQVVLFDTQGHQARTYGAAALQAAQALSLAGLSPGLYLVSVLFSNGKSSQQRILKQY